jgi:hypothetical protein
MKILSLLNVKGVILYTIFYMYTCIELALDLFGEFGIKK